MADIFISYTSSDGEWAKWLHRELAALGHTPHIHEWEIGAGEDIYAWMEKRHDAADHVLCVVSPAYLDEVKAPYSAIERNAAFWQAASKRPGFVLLVVVEQSRLPTLPDRLRRCEVFGVPEDVARRRLADYMAKRGEPQPASFPGKAAALSNIPVRLPEHFLGRDDALDAIDRGLKRYEGRVAITALHGLRGVGKTTLAAAYADRRRAGYRATWWIRAQSADGMRADLVALGVRLGWLPADAKDEPSLPLVMERLAQEGDGLLLIYDNAIDAAALRPFLPKGGGARVLVTSNFHAWRGLAEPVEIRLWPKEIGADYLVARTGRAGERAAAEALSEALGGLPLAHEQAAAYCERLSVSPAEYLKRFEAQPAKFLDDARHAPGDYHDGRTVAKTFALAIAEAAKLHPAAEPLLALAAILPPEPIPIFLFAEGREAFPLPRPHESGGEVASEASPTGGSDTAGTPPLGSAAQTASPPQGGGEEGRSFADLLADDGLDEALAALSAFALIDREDVPDERDPTIRTACFRLHRLVRQVAARDGDASSYALLRAMVAVYPENTWRNPAAWVRCRLLDRHAQALAGMAHTTEADVALAALLDGLAAYRNGALAAYAAAGLLFQRSLDIRERVLGPDHPDTATSYDHLAYNLNAQGRAAEAEPLYRKALAIRERVLGPDHPDTASSYNNVASNLNAQGRAAEAEPLYRKALAIRERVLGPDHPDTAASYNNVAYNLNAQGRAAEAEPLYRKALAIRERVLGPDHPDTAASYNNVAYNLNAQGRAAEAEPLYRKALAISERLLGPDHPDTAASYNNVAYNLNAQGRAAEAEPLYRKALKIRERVLGPDHPDTAASYNNVAFNLDVQGRGAEAEPLYRKALEILEMALGVDHPNTRLVRANLDHFLGRHEASYR